MAVPRGYAVRTFGIDRVSSPPKGSARSSTQRHVPSSRSRPRPESSLVKGRPSTAKRIYPSSGPVARTDVLRAKRRPAIPRNGRIVHLDLRSRGWTTITVSGWFAGMSERTSTEALRVSHPIVACISHTRISAGPVAESFCPPTPVNRTASPAPRDPDPSSSTAPVGTKRCTKGASGSSIV